MWLISSGCFKMKPHRTIQGLCLLKGCFLVVDESLSQLLYNHVIVSFEVFLKVFFLNVRIGA
jgi:hypothetical protein